MPFRLREARPTPLRDETFLPAGDIDNEQLHDVHPSIFRPHFQTNDALNPTL